MISDPLAFSTDWTLRQRATFQPTMALRWRMEIGSDGSHPILEQMWKLEYEGGDETKWLPVETVVE